MWVTFDMSNELVAGGAKDFTILLIWHENQIKRVECEIKQKWAPGRIIRKIIFHNFFPNSSAVRVIKIVLRA